jgi:hypothetical protein
MTSNLVAMEKKEEKIVLNTFCNRLTNCINGMKEKLSQKDKKVGESISVQDDQGSNFEIIYYLKEKGKKLYSLLYPKGIFSKDGIIHSLAYFIIICGAWKNQYLVKKLLEVVIIVIGKVVVDGTIVTSRMILSLFETLLPKIGCTF